MGWDARFADPIPLDRGRELVTLRDAAGYIMKLPKAEQEREAWQTAADHLMRAAESTPWLFLARIAMLQALLPDRPTPPQAPRQKPAKKYRVIR